MIFIIYRHIFFLYIAIHILLQLSLANCDDLNENNHELTHQSWEKHSKLQIYDHIHRKAKYSVRENKINLAMKKYFDRLNITTKKQTLALHFCGSLNYRMSRHFNWFNCLQKFQQSSSQDSEKSPVIILQRKLLSMGIQTTEGGNISRNMTEKTKEESEKFKEFLATIERKLSKDPQRAMYSILFLLAVVVAAMKLCGMRMAKNIREEPPDFESQVLYMNVYDIIKMKRAYLPQKLIQWNRKVRRKLRKKKTIQRAPLIEQDLGDPPSDNTDEEKMIYADVCDF